jgi:hypothetical protein
MQTQINRGEPRAWASTRFGQRVDQLDVLDAYLTGIGATRQGWSVRRLNAKNQLKHGLSSSGCESRPAKAEPSQPEVSLATVVGKPLRRCVDRRAGEPWCNSPENFRSTGCPGCQCA